MKKLLFATLAMLVLVAGFAMLSSDDASANVTVNQKQIFGSMMVYPEHRDTFIDKIVDTGVYDVTYSVGAELSNTITVTLTMLGYDGSAVDEQKVLYCWITDANSGTAQAGITANAPTSDTAAGSHGALHLTDAGTRTKFWVFSNTSNGTASVVITQTAAIAAQYLACRRDDGDIEVSGAVDFN